METSAYINPVPARRRSLVFWTVTGLIALDTILFTMVVPALPEFAERDGFGKTTAALIFAAFPIAQLITALAAATLVERIGRRPVIIGAVVLLGLATLAFAVAEGVIALGGARAAQGAAAGFVWTAGMACIADIYPRNQLGLRMGLAETAGGATGLIGPVVGGGLIALVGVQSAFLFAAALPALALIPSLAVPETRRPETPQPPNVLRALRRLASVPRARVSAAALALFAGGLALLEPLMPLDLSSRLGTGPFGIGLVFGAGLAAYYVVIPFAGRYSDRHGRRRPLVAGGVVMAAGLPAIALAPTAFGVAIAFAVVGAGMACVAAPSGPLMVEAIDETEMLGNYGVSGAVLTALFAAGYSAGPLLGAATSAVMPFVGTVAVAAALALGVSAWSYRRLPAGA
jgi:MFS transporter, DHA1 family, solute carrier family 18 (vesicular amine transporter), member 1/2